MSPTASSENSRRDWRFPEHMLDMPIPESSHFHDPLRDDGWEAVNHRTPRLRLPTPDQIRNYDSIAQLRVGPEPSPPDLATCHSHSHHPPPPHPRRFRPLSRHLPGHCCRHTPCPTLSVEPWSRGPARPNVHAHRPVPRLHGSSIRGATFSLIPTSRRGRNDRLSYFPKRRLSRCSCRQNSST